MIISRKSRDKCEIQNQLQALPNHSGQGMANLIDYHLFELKPSNNYARAHNYDGHLLIVR